MQSGEDEPKIGAVLELGDRLRDMTRRQFLRTLGIAGTGAAGLSGLIESVYGQTPEGVPIVHTYDIHDEPEQVRITSEERYRRLKVFVSLPESFMERNPLVNEVGIIQRSRDEDDLALILYVDAITPQTRSALPNQVQEVPIVYRERHMIPLATTVAGDMEDEVPYSVDMLSVPGMAGGGHSPSSALIKVVTTKCCLLRTM